jgi:hypothetical protein
MEPKQAGANGGREHAPSFERSHGEMPSFGFEQAQNGAHERAHEQAPEVRSAQAEVSQIAMPALPVPIAQDDQTSSLTSQDDAVLLAADDDLIEKEWVDKAKRILAETKDDPYTREQEIGKLQVEYIRKRYGREIGASTDNE